MKKTYHLFECAGIEIEYMIVENGSLAILPIADRILIGPSGRRNNEIEAGPLHYSNELARHVIELKNPTPVKELYDADIPFTEGANHIAKKLKEFGAMLLPSGMHPMWAPRDGAELWPGRQSKIYQAYDRIFHCTGHGWVNLQSVHLNLPFSGDGEFALLHEAIRLLLPLIPALSASTPLAEGSYSEFHDTRLHHYGLNQKKIPEISGQVIPDRASGEKEYRAKILKPIYRAIDAYDPERVLRGEWLNSRGAIARFERSAIEIRVIDTQESPFCDIALALLITKTLQELTQDAGKLAAASNISTGELAAIYEKIIRSGEEAVIEHKEYLALWGYELPVSAKEIWSGLIGRVLSAKEKKRYQAFYDEYQKSGSLSSRIKTRLGPEPSRDSINRLYRELGEALLQGGVFSP